MPSFISRIPDLEKIGPIIQIVIMPSLPYLQINNIGGANVKTLRVTALIDTGASSSVIQAGLATQLGIKPVGSVNINTPSSVNVPCNQYDICLQLPNNVRVPSIIVTETPLKGQNIQALIGRDILKHCVLVYTGYDDSFSLSL